MKKAIIFTLMAAAGLMCFTACGQKFADVDLKVKQITVTSSSVNKSGRLLTESAADKSPNSPLGSNKSPQLTWNTVDGAGCYAVCMFDEDANWLHWFAAGIQKTTLNVGEYTDKKQYVGPYPPQFVGRHHYRIEVFALKKAPEGSVGKMDAQQSYKDIVNQLNQEGGKSDNILARGSIVATYANGDNNK